MSHGSVLKNFNSELERSLETIHDRRQNVINEINKEQETRSNLEEQKLQIKNELYNIEKYLSSKYELIKEFDKTINNSENAFRKILENSKTLMNIVKKEEFNIMRKLENSDDNKDAKHYDYN